MDIKVIKLKKGMTKYEVNNLISRWLILEDETYMGAKYHHTWTCKSCSLKFKRTWNIIKSKNRINCGCIEYNKVEKRYKQEVEKTGKYEYIRSYRSGEVFSSKVMKVPSLLIKHKYCGNTYIITAKGFINDGNKCSKCCGSYENSFAYHIEVELGEPLEKYWDFEKNTLNPYHISKHYNGKVFIKCQEKDYHESYETICNDFIKGRRCGYCYPAGKTPKVHPKDSFGQWLSDNDLSYLWSDKNIIDAFKISKSSNLKIWMLCDKKDYHNDNGGYEISCANFVIGQRCGYCKPASKNQKVHPKDSFAQYHIDNTDKDFLEKYWDWDKNTVNPWEITPGSGKRVWIKCQNEEINKLNGLKKKDYHGSYEIPSCEFTGGTRCSYCWSRKIHPYDSFGYHHFDKVMSWHPDNKISPFKVSKSSSKKYKFICQSCGEIWMSTISNINGGKWCPICSSSKGEKKVKSWLDEHNINYIYDEPCFNDLTGIGGNPLRPDFILPNHKIWIEYDGKFHFKKMYDDDGHEIIKEHDKLKDNYAKKHGWKLIRIPYWEFDNIKFILEKEILL